MRTNNCSSLIAFVAALMAMTSALPGRLPAQTSGVNSSAKKRKVCSGPL